MPQFSTQIRLRGNGESLEEPVLDGLCASCSKIPFEHIFDDENAFQYRVGDLDVLRERERTCRFCQSLTSIYEHIFSPYLKDAGNPTFAKLTVLLPDPLGSV
jgi:hypothetical protein